MRNDMRHVLIDRPRHKSWENGHERNKYKSNDEEAPNKETIRPKGRGVDRKDLSDNLAPLFRFLKSNVGRPWNKVYSEICENISLDSTLQRHILVHVKHAVHQDVEMGEDGLPYSVVKYYYNDNRPLMSRGHWDSFYVNPNTGILCVCPRQKKETKKSQVTLITLPDNKLIQYRLVTKSKWSDKTRSFVRVTSWWGIELAKRPEPTKHTIYTREWDCVKGCLVVTKTEEKFYEDGRDVLFDKELRNLSEQESFTYYNNYRLYAIRMWQLSSKELKTIRRTIGEVV